MTAACHRSAFVPPQPLIQLRRSYTATCWNLRLSVQTDADGWMAHVRATESGPELYSAYRCSLGAAKVAAAEFAAFRADAGAPQKCPEAVAQQLPWKECW